MSKSILTSAKFEGRVDAIARYAADGGNRVPSEVEGGEEIASAEAPLRLRRIGACAEPFI